MLTEYHYKFCLPRERLILLNFVKSFLNLLVLLALLLTFFKIQLMTSFLLYTKKICETMAQMIKNRFLELLNCKFEIATGFYGSCQQHPILQEDL